MTINIKKLDKAKVLAALYNNARPLGAGIIHYRAEDITVEQARELLKKHTYFDYIQGRVMKIDLSGDIVDTRLYNRDNGPNAAEKVIEGLEKKLQKK
jgi:hypothetical protein